MDINAPTVIYLNEKEHYPNGYKASIEFGLEDHKIRAKIDQTERNFYKVELHQIEKDSVFKTTMASIVITKDLLEKSGTKQSSYLKMFYEIADSHNDNVTFHINNFHTLGQKKKLRIEIYGRSGKKYCTINGDQAMEVEECSGPNHDMTITTFHILEDRHIYEAATVFQDSVKGLNNSLVNVNFAWRGVI
jgi:hypothetical protein